jgi:hypothetical protein
VSTGPDDVLDDEELSGDEAGESVAGGSDDPFFVSKQAAAVFKHKLLKVYFPKFAGKAGANEPDNRLVYVDTHAGRGAYNDDTPGSPLLIAQNAAGMSQRSIDCIFIEKNRANHARLTQVLTDASGTPSGGKRGEAGPVTASPRPSRTPATRRCSSSSTPTARHPDVAD